MSYSRAQGDISVTKDTDSRNSFVKSRGSNDNHFNHVAQSVITGSPNRPLVAYGKDNVYGRDQKNTGSIFADPSLKEDNFGSRDLRSNQYLANLSRQASENKPVETKRETNLGYPYNIYDNRSNDRNHLREYLQDSKPSGPIKATYSFQQSNDRPLDNYGMSLGSGQSRNGVGRERDNYGMAESTIKKDYSRNMLHSDSLSHNASSSTNYTSNSSIRKAATSVFQNDENGYNTKISKSMISGDPYGLLGLKNIGNTCFM
mgnify:FL=1